MNLLLPILLLSGQPKLMTGQQAVDRVKLLLAAFGVPKPYRLQSLGTSYNPGGNDFTHVVLTDAKKRSYEAYLRRENLRLWRGSESSGFGGFERTPANGTHLESRFRAWMAAYRTQEPIRQDAVTTDQRGIGHAGFSILRNGYPFVVSWQRFGYDFAADAKGEFLSFYAVENPPPVNVRKPRLTEQAALKVLERTYELKNAGGGRVHYRYRLMRPITLGYFLPKGASKAMLVWRIPFTATTETDFGSRGGSTAMLIDAITGQPIPTEVVP